MQYPLLTSGAKNKENIVNETGNNVVRQEIVEFEPPPDMLAQARDALTKTAPKARIIPNKVAMSTTRAQYERWKQATGKELRAFRDCLEGAYSRTTGTLPCSQEEDCHELASLQLQTHDCSEECIGIARR